MKKRVSLVGTLTLVLFFTTSFSFRENPQDFPRGSKKHIKLAKDINGQKTELDTIIEGDKILVWQGDTIGKSIDVDSIRIYHIKTDTVLEPSAIEYTISKKSGNGGHKMVMIKSGEHEPEVYEFEGGGKGNAVWMSIDSDGENLTGVSRVIASPRAKVAKSKTNKNIIDLSDPGIISYEKKKLSGGREKIEIIRQTPEENSLKPDVIIKKHAKGSEPDPNSCYTVKTVTAKKGGNGVFSIIEGDSIQSTEGSDRVIIIKSLKEPDIKNIRIEDAGKGGGKKVKITVEKEGGETKGNK
jgi:hypothetical protein